MCKKNMKCYKRKENMSIQICSHKAYTILMWIRIAYITMC